MWFWLIPLILAIGSTLTILVVLIRVSPRVSVIDVETIAKERVRKVKEQLIMDRFARLRNKRLGAVAKGARGAVQGASKLGRRAVQKLYKLEQQYKKLQQAAMSGTHTLDEDATKRLLDEAETLVREEEYIPAEKKYIEVISHQPKNIRAYEGLGNLYLKDRKFDQARETLSFALKISPNDASIHMSLAEIELKEDHAPEALVHLRKCFEKRPKNPKYLDLYLETSLDEEAVDDAKKALAQMKEVNPENTKIPEWEERLKQVSEANPSQGE